MMTLGDLRAWMERHDLNAEQAADYLDLDRKTIDRYLIGELQIPTRVSTSCYAFDPTTLYRLTPIGDLDHVDWRSSRYRGTRPVIVRAQEENLARWHAAAVFHVVARRRPTDIASPVNPWRLRRRVKAEKMAPNGIWRDDGKIGVISHLVVNRAFLWPHSASLDDANKRAYVEQEFGRLQESQASLKLSNGGGVIELEWEVNRNIAEEIRNSVQALLARAEHTGVLTAPASPRSVPA